MKPQSASAEIRSQVKELSGSLARPVSREEIRSVVDSIMASMAGDVTATDLRLYDELSALAKFIESARNEIAAVNPHDISEQHIPLATDELDAVIGATEEATGTILDACETIENVATTLPPETAEILSNAVTRVYEACNFQDVTGQRIAKVVKTLQHIEARVFEILAAFGEQLGPDGAVSAAPVDLVKPAAAESPKGDSSLLNGPQLPDDAMKQAEIDAILASFD